MHFILFWQSGANQMQNATNAEKLFEKASVLVTEPLHTHTRQPVCKGLLHSSVTKEQPFKNIFKLFFLVILS